MRQYCPLSHTRSFELYEIEADSSTKIMKSLYIFCSRCKRLFTEEPKGVPMAIKKVEQKKKEPEKPLPILEKPT